MPLIVLPAAGSSSRMGGRDKLMETIEGVPLLRRQTLRAMATGCPVAIILPEGHTIRREALRGLAVQVEEVTGARAGMSVSLRRAAELLSPDQPLGILLPDVPGIETKDILAVLAEFRARGGRDAVRGAGSDGTPGTPLFLPYRIALKFSDLTGDEGGRSALEDETVRLAYLKGDRASRDLDTPEDWAAWRTETGFAD